MSEGGRTGASATVSWVPLLLMALLVCLVTACSDDTPADDGDSRDGVDAGTEDTGTADVPGGVDAPSGWYDGNYTNADVGEATENCVNGADDNGDGAVDCADSACASRMICTLVLTGESEGNNSTESAQPVTLPVALRGAIGDPRQDDDGDWDEDRDWYTFDISEPTMVRWAYDDSNGPALLRLRLTGLDDENDFVSQLLDIDTPGAVRHSYLPVAGTYGLEVRDARNSGRSGEEIPYGNDGFVYAVELAAVDFTATAESLPLDTGAVSFGDDNMLPAFKFTRPGNEVLEIDVEAERLDPTSGLDAMVWLVDATSRELIGRRDDTSTSTSDPLLRTGLSESGSEVIVIVDAYEVAFESRHILRIESLEPSQDREPNDPADLAFPLEPGVAVDGQVGEPFLRFRSNLTDMDYYLIPGDQAAAYSVSVEATGGDLDVGIRTGFLTYSRGFPLISEVFISDPAGSRDARIEATSLFERSLLIQVGDRRNMFDTEAERVGGAGYEYTLEVERLTRDFEPVEPPVDASYELSRPGEMDWTILTAPATSLLTVGALPADGADDAFAPWIYLSDQSSEFLTRDAESVHYLSTVETVYHVGVVDRSGGGGEGFDYDLTIDAQTFAAANEVEPNNGPPEGGQVLTGDGPWWVTGELTGNPGDTDLDLFLVALEAGDVVHVETTDGVVEGDDADTRLEISGPGLEEPVSDDDGGVGRFSAATVEATADGTFEVALTPWCDERTCRPGDYSLVVWVE